MTELERLIAKHGKLLTKFREKSAKLLAKHAEECAKQLDPLQEEVLSLRRMIEAGQKAAETAPGAASPEVAAPTDIVQPAFTGVKP